MGVRPLLAGAGRTGMNMETEGLSEVTLAHLTCPTPREGSASCGPLYPLSVLCYTPPAPLVWSGFGLARSYSAFRSWVTVTFQGGFPEPHASHHLQVGLVSISHSPIPFSPRTTVFLGHKEGRAGRWESCVLQLVPRDDA